MAVAAKLISDEKFDQKMVKNHSNLAHLYWNL